MKEEEGTLSLDPSKIWGAYHKLSHKNLKF
jgi:hypothetical protein